MARGPGLSKHSSSRLSSNSEARREEARGVFDRKTDFERSSGWQGYVEKMKNFDVQWRGRMARANPPWLHASDYNPPLTFSKVEDLHAVIFGFYSSFDFFSVAATGKQGHQQEVMKDRAQMWSDLMRWSLQNETNAIAFLDKWLHDGEKYGAGFGYLPWLQLQRTMRTELYIPDEMKDDRRIADSTLIKAALRDRLLKGPTGDASGFDITFVDDDGEDKDAKAWVERDHPFKPEGEPVVMIERDVVYYDAPAPRVIPPWHMKVPAQSRCLQTARRFWVEDFMDFMEVEDLARKGIFNMISAEDLSNLRIRDNRRYPNMSSSGHTTDDAVDSRMDQESIGLHKLQTRQNELKITYEYAFEDGKSIVRATTEEPHRILLMRHNVEFLYPHGRRPFFDWHYQPVDHRYNGMGICEILEGTQVEENAWSQSRSDVLEIVTKPGGMYNPMSGLAPDEIRWKPGMMVKVRDTQNAFNPFVFPVNPTQLLQEQQVNERHAESAIGSTDMGLGRGPTRPNAPRTASGTAIIVRQQQLRMDVILKRSMFGPGETTGGIKEFLLQYMGLYAAFMPEHKEFRALGTNEIRAISRADLQGRFDFVVDFGPDINNPQLQLQNAMLRYQNLIANPLVQRDLSGLWRVTTDFAEATGMRDAKQALRKPPEAEERPPMSQEEENNVLSKGIYIEPLVSDNHTQHIAEIQGLINDQSRLAQNFSPREMQLLERHLNRHMELMIASQMLQQQQQQGGGNGGPPGGQGAQGVGVPQDIGTGAPQEIEAGF